MTATGRKAERRGSDGAPDCGSSTRNQPTTPASFPVGPATQRLYMAHPDAMRCRHLRAEVGPRGEVYCPDCDLGRPHAGASHRSGVPDARPRATDGGTVNEEAWKMIGDILGAGDAAVRSEPCPCGHDWRYHREYDGNMCREDCTFDHGFVRARWWNHRRPSWRCRWFGHVPLVQVVGPADGSQVHLKCPRCGTVVYVHDAAEPYGRHRQPASRDWIAEGFSYPKRPTGPGYSCTNAEWADLMATEASK